jgi:FtsP/CotA-like multicopper oxidase with cupredoxin domain
VPVTGGERLRLRLINAANARVFGLRFRGLTGWRIAVDSHPVGPESLGDEAVVVPPGGRVDLILDMTGAAGDLFDVEEGYYGGEAFALARFQVDDGAPVRPTPPPPPEPLAANPVTPPNLEAAEAHNMAFEGGAMGGLAQAEFQGKTMDLRQIAAMGLIWAVNGRVIAPMRADDPGDPMLSLRLGRSYRLTWTNRTAFDHPIHLHGHSFHVLSRNGKRLDRPVIMDTVLIPRGEEVEVVFVADNPGDWALHCHILEHAEAGMMGYVRVS